MNKYLFLILISMLLCDKNNYWNLGLAITNQSKKVIKKDIKINDIIAEDSYILNKNTTIYTLDKSYIVEPKKYENAMNKTFKYISQISKSDKKLFRSSKKSFERLTKN